MTGLAGQSVRTLHGEPIGVWETDDGGKLRAPICFVGSGVSGGGSAVARRGVGLLGILDVIFVFFSCVFFTHFQTLPVSRGSRA